MIDRYSTPEMQAIFSDVGKFSRYLEIELLATDAQSSVGVVPPEAAKACRANAPRVDDGFVRRVVEREAITNHDVAAFVDVVQASIGQPHGAWIHHGLTSSDVVDTAWCWMLRDAADLIIGALDELIRTTARRAKGASQHGDDGPNAWHARRTHHLRRKVGVVCIADGP